MGTEVRGRGGAFSVRRRKTPQLLRPHRAAFEAIRVENSCSVKLVSLVLTPSPPELYPSAFFLVSHHLSFAFPTEEEKTTHGLIHGLLFPLHMKTRIKFLCETSLSLLARIGVPAPHPQVHGSLAVELASKWSLPCGSNVLHKCHLLAPYPPAHHEVLMK